MGFRDIWPYAGPLGGHTSVRWAPMTASQAFLAGEVIQVVDAGTVTAIHKDGAQLVLADAESASTVGVALNGPGAAATAELTAANGWGRLWIHPDSGDTYANTSFLGTLGSPRIWYVPFGDPDQLFITRIAITAGGATAGAAFTGADRGEPFQITYCSGPTPDVGWGLERTAAAQGTDFIGTIIDVLDAQGKSVAIGGTGVAAVFSVTI